MVAGKNDEFRNNFFVAKATKAEETR